MVKSTILRKDEYRLFGSVIVITPWDKASRYFECYKETIVAKKKLFIVSVQNIKILFLSHIFWAENSNVLICIQMLENTKYKAGIELCVCVV